MKSRVHMIVCFEFDNSGNRLISEKQIASVLEKKAEHIDKAAYILHDKDVVRQDDIDDNEERYEAAVLSEYSLRAKMAGLAVDKHNVSGYVQDDILEKACREDIRRIIPKLTLGQLKPAHWHIVIITSSRRQPSEVSRWFGLKANFDKLYTGQGGENRALAYLTHNHKNKSEKVIYPVEEVHDIGFSYKDWLSGYLIRKRDSDAINELTKDDIRLIIGDIARGRITPVEAREKLGDVLYIEQLAKIDKAYSERPQKMPDFRSVIYIDSEEVKIGPDGKEVRGGQGLSGSGKTTLSKAIASYLATKYYGAPYDTDFAKVKQSWIFFAGAGASAWSSYKGQPIIVVDECSASDFHKIFKGYEGVKRFLDSSPMMRDDDVKFSHVALTAEWIIVNGIQPFEQFVRECGYGAGDERPDVVLEQYKRRFQFVLTLHSRKMESQFYSITPNGVLEKRWLDVDKYYECNLVPFVRYLWSEEMAAYFARVLLPVVSLCEDLNKLRLSGPVKPSASDLNIPAYQFTSLSTRDKKEVMTDG